MNLTAIAMTILSHHPVQLLATTVLLAHLARAIFGERRRQPVPRGAGARAFEPQVYRLFTAMGTPRDAKRLAKQGAR